MLGVRTKQVGRQMDEGTCMAASWTFARPSSECKLARGKGEQWEGMALHGGGVHACRKGKLDNVRGSA